MGSQVVTAVALSNKGTQFYILDRYFFTPDTHGQDLFQFFLLKQVTAIGDPFLFLLVQIFVHTLLQPEIGDLRRIRDKGEDRMIQVIVYSLQDSRYQIFTQPFPFAVNIPVASA